MRGLQIGAGFRDCKLVQEGLQIGVALGISKWGGLQIVAGISNRGKEISNWGRDYKSGQERFQIGAGITNRCRTSAPRRNSFRNRCCSS